MAEASVGERVRRLRKLLRLSQRELGELFEMYGDDLGNVESNRRKLNASRLRLLAALERAVAHHAPEVVYPWRSCGPRFFWRQRDEDVTPRLAHIYKLATEVPQQPEQPTRDAA